MTPAAIRQRLYRARKGARVGFPGGPAPTAPCGTVSAFKRHQRHKEPPCRECADVWNEYQRIRYWSHPSRARD
jgi:hypothetical protein